MTGGHDDRDTRVEAMRLEDLDAVLEIEHASFPTPWTREHFVAEIRNGRIAWNPVLRAGGRVVGYACVWFIEGEARINDIAVAPDLRRRGHGRRLVGIILDEARRRRCTEATLEVRPSNRAAHDLYESLGFRETGRRRGYYQDSGEDAILMALALPVAQRPDGPRTKEAGMKDLEATREKLARDDPNYRRLTRKHEECEERLAELRSRRFLTDDEQLEEVNLKKLKLHVKDQMEDLVRKHLPASAGTGGC